MRAPEADAAHWRRTRNLAVAVLIVWAVGALGVFWALLPLQATAAPGFATAYWYAAQASLLLFVLLGFYANWRQDGIDRAFGERD